MKNSNLSQACKHSSKRFLAMLCAIMLVATMLPMYVTAADFGGLYEGWRHVSYDALAMKENASDYISYDSWHHTLTVDAMDSNGEFLYLNRDTNEEDNNNSGALNLQQFDKDTMNNFVIEFDVKFNDFAEKAFVNTGIPGAVSPAGIGLAFSADKSGSLHTSNIMARVDYTNIGFLMYDWPSDSSVGKPYANHFNYVGDYTGAENEATNVVQYHWMYNYYAQPHVKVTKVGKYIRMDVTNTVSGQPYTVAATLADSIPLTGYVGLVVENANVTFSNVTVTRYADSAADVADLTLANTVARAEYFTDPNYPDWAITAGNAFESYGIYEGWRHATPNKGAGNVVSYDAATHAITINNINADGTTSRGTHSLYLNRWTDEAGKNSSAENALRFNAGTMTDYTVKFDVTIPAYLSERDDNAFCFALMGDSAADFGNNTAYFRINKYGISCFAAGHTVFEWYPNQADGAYISSYFGSPVTVTVIQSGRQITAYLGDTQVGTGIMPDSVNLPTAGHIGFYVNSAIKATISNVTVTNTTDGLNDSAFFFGAGSGATYTTVGNAYEGWQHISDAPTADGYVLHGGHAIRLNALDYMQSLFLNRDAEGDNNLLFPFANMTDFTVSYDVAVNALNHDASKTLGAISLAILGQDSDSFEKATIQARVDQDNLGFMWRGAYEGVTNPYALNDWWYVDGSTGGIASGHGLIAAGNTFRVTVTKVDADKALTITVTKADGTSIERVATYDEVVEGSLPTSGYIGLRVENADVTVSNVQVTNNNTAAEKVYFAADTVHEHMWNDANCTAPAYCAGCAATTGEALGHDFVGSGINAVCQRGCGMTWCEAKGHTYTLIPAVTPTTTKCGYTAGSKCSVCDKVLVAPKSVGTLDETTSTGTTLIDFSESDAADRIKFTGAGATAVKNFTIEQVGTTSLYDGGTAAMQAGAGWSQPFITLCRKPDAATNAIALKVNIPNATLWSLELMETSGDPIDGGLLAAAGGSNTEVHRTNKSPYTYPSSACIYLMQEVNRVMQVTEVDLSKLYDPRDFLPDGFDGWIVYPLDVFQEQVTLHGEPDSGLQIENVGKIMIDYVTEEAFTVDTVVAVEDINGFLGTDVCGTAHTWGVDSCTEVACSVCGVTANGQFHNWDGNACAVCGTAMFEIAENFDNQNILESDNNYNIVSCTSPFGTALNYFRLASTTASLKFQLDKAGAADNQALAFWYDATASGWFSDATMQIFLHKGDHTLRLRNTPDGAYNYFIVSDGVITQKAVAEVSKIAIPEDSCGWIILPLPAKVGVESTTDGTTFTAEGVDVINGIDAVSIKYADFANASIVVDQFGFVNDVNAFAALAATGDENMPGYTADTSHNWNGTVCADCGTSLFDIREDFTNFSGGYATGSASPSCDSPFGDSVTFTYSETMNATNWMTAAGYDVISFGSKGLSNDEGIAFYYDATDATADVKLRFALFDATGTTASCIEHNFPVTTIIDGVRTENTTLIYSNNRMLLPKGTSGWVIIDVRASSRIWNHIGHGPHTNQYIGGFGVCLENDTAVLLDQFGFVRDVNTFAGLAVAGNESVPGYGIKHTYGEATCVAPQTCVHCFATTGTVSHFHNWENGFCTYCLSPEIAFIGTSVNEDETALRFGFAFEANDITVRGYTRNLDNATVTIDGKDYKLVDFGAIVSNKAGLDLIMSDVDNKRTKQISAVKLFALEDDTAYFACGVTGIPNKSYFIYARSYYVYLDEQGNQVFIYGDMQSQSIQGWLDG